MKRALRTALSLLISSNFLFTTLASAQTTAAAKVAATTDRPASSAGFDASASAALHAMKTRAGELKVTGVAIVAYFEGDQIQSWTSKMEVVGRFKDEPSATGKGSNLLAIAYAKASEMADTLKDSGSNIRPPMTGEFGWAGGVIARGKTGYIIAAFSGGKSEDDVKISHAGVDQLKLNY